jgi:hypothetical protein
MKASIIAAEAASFLPRVAHMIGGARRAIPAVALGCLGLPAAAATLNVAAGAVAVANNGICSLREAIHNANADAQVDNSDCPAGSGTDTLQLAAGSTYTLTDADPVSTQDGLPAITSTLVINGAGASIERSSGLTCFLDGAQQVGEFRLLSIPNGGDATLNNLSLRNGCADGASGQVSGAGIRSFGRLTLTQVLFEGNRSASTGGGLAASFNNPVSITSSTFSNNFAAESAGAIISNLEVAMTVSGSTITGNSAGGGEAGGILNRGTLTLVNSTVIGNTALDVGGGGISNDATGTLRLDAVTISANKTAVATGGGGVRNLGALTVKNSIIAGNFEGGDCTGAAPGTFTALGKNLDSDGSCVALDSVRFSRVTAAQMALAPASFSAGGRTLAPLFGSVAVDAVTDCTRIDGSTVNAVDQLGNNRPQNGDTTPGAACDIGAIERAPVGGVLNVSGACTLGDAIAAANSDSTVGGCVDSGAGPDLLVLGANAVLAAADTTRSTLQLGAFAGLPDVSSEIVITAGAGNVIERAPAATCATPDPGNEFRLLNVLGNGTLTLAGLTLRNGCADVGGAVLVAGGKLAVVGGSFSGNTARSATAGAIQSARGGAVALEGANATGAFQGATFSGNLAAHTSLIAAGGAIATGAPEVSAGGPIEVRDCSFDGNSAVGSTISAGGAIAAASLPGSTIAGSTFSSNHSNGPSDASGGAVLGALAVLSNSRFVDNQALGGPTQPGRGGGVFVFSEAPVIKAWLSGLVFERNRSSTDGGGLHGQQPLTLLRSRFSENIARSLGADDDAVGGGASLGGDALISDVTFENNLAEGFANPAGNGTNAVGGGLFLNGPIRLTNVTFRGNRAIGGASTGGTGGYGRGGGLAVASATPRLILVTMADNQAIAGTGSVANGTVLGGGLYAGAGVEVRSSLLEGNTTTVGATTTPSDCAGAAGSLGFNTIGTPTDCNFSGTNDQVGAASSLLALGDHGCTVKLPGGSCLPTMPVRLSAPALDRSDCEGYGPFIRDARQFSRPIDIPGVANAGNACDAGAYESRDGDADGVEDWVDNCPFVANPAQLDRDLNLGAPPVSIWRLDDGQGTAVGDGFGTRAGTLSGNPQWVSGISGAALAFDGTGDGVIIPHDAAFNPPVGGDFSVTAWVKLPASQVQTGRTTNVIVGKDQEGGVGFPFPWVLRVYNQTAAAGAIGHLQGTRGDGTAFPQVVSTSRIDDGRWHHAAYIKRGSVLEMWVDGVLEASATDTTTTASGNTRFVGIGQREAVSAKLDLRGSVDEVLYMASALSGAQVLGLYQRRSLAGDGLGTACDCDDADPTNTSAACVNLFANGFESP